MSPRTIFLSRLFGLYCLIVVPAMVLNKEATVAKVTALMQDPPVMLVLGVFTLIAGLAMVLGHNVWSGGAAPVLVTLLGWSTLAKGALFLFLPPGLEPRFFLEQLHYAQLFYLYMAITLALGLYLTYAGFAAAPKAVASD